MEGECGFHLNTGRFVIIVEMCVSALSPSSYAYHHFFGQISSDRWKEGPSSHNRLAKQETGL